MIAPLTTDPTPAPVAFAQSLYSDTAELFPDQLIVHAPREYRAYQAAYARLVADYPAAVGFERPLTTLDERVLEYAGEAFWDGVRFGIAVDQLRRSVLAIHAGAVADQDAA